MMSHQIHIDVFEGPMDLLLHLIKKENVDITDIPITEITREYLGYLGLIQKLSLDNAGEFLVMVSTLLQIKAKTLMPETEKESDEGPDPRADLVAKLLEYKKFKEAARILSEKYAANREVFYREEPVFEKDDFIVEATVFDLLGAFKSILSRVKDEIKEIIYEDIPVESKIREILTALEHKEYITFEDIFALETRRAGFIAAFLAMLELIRTKQILARQSKIFGGIRMYKGKPVEQDDLILADPADNKTENPEKDPHSIETET